MRFGFVTSLRAYSTAFSMTSTEPELLTLSSDTQNGFTSFW